MNVSKLYTSGVNSSTISFNGLKKIAQRTLYESSDVLKIPTANSASAMVGALPNDYIKKLLAANPINKKAAIVDIQQAFGKAADSLNQINLANKQGLQNIVNGSKEERLEAFKQILEKIRKLDDSYFFDDDYRSTKLINWSNPENSKKSISQAQSILESTLKKHKVLSQTDNIRIDDLGEGMFGRAFRISCKNNNGENVLSDKVMKVYKDISQEEDFMANSALLKKKVINESLPELKQHLKKQTALYPNQKTFFIQAENSLNIPKRFEDMSENDFFQYQKRVSHVDLQQFDKAHGLYREANSTAFIKKAMGHKMDNSNLAKQYLFDLKANYALSEFIPKSPAHKYYKHTNLDNLGIFYADESADNIISGKIIDLGGMVPSEKKLSENPLTRRIYKKLQNASDLNTQTSIFNQQYELMLKTTDSTKKESIKNALTLHLDGLRPSEILALKLPLNKLYELSPRAYSMVSGN
ncbi:MAG: hypothetical protein PHV37_02145 [Candidatus Gastranaerophilales bacterium]|nr:hypothetical protein [Candidatus Gastranaerophilales bacterium]